MNKLLTIIVTITVSAACALAEEQPADTAAIYFRQSKTALIPGYKNNEESLSRLATELADSGSILKKHVRVIGSASPEGTVKFNRYLSEKRAQRIFDYFSDRELIPSDSTEFIYTGRNWAGLRAMVEADESVPAREEVLSLLDKIINGEITDDNDALLRLKHIDGGQAYLYMYYKLFPALRASWIYVDFARPLPQPIVLHSSSKAELVDTYSPLPLPTINTSYSFPRRKPFYMGVKTNMLYDVLALPSVGAEFYLGKNFSVVGNWTYGWWDNNNTHYYWRAYGGDIAMRWWFGDEAHRKPLTGHHVGVFGGIITYDFELGGNGYMGGDPGRTLWDRFNTMAGGEYGYSLPVGRRLNIDFTIGFGYLGGRVIKYVPKDNRYLWKSTRQLTWVGPVKAEISLVWLIGNGNYNIFKGRATK